MTCCAYCGDLADTIDHTVPVSFTHARRRKGSMVNGYPRVPCCFECNSLLGSKLFPTIRHRASYLADALTKRYAAILRGSQWTTDELDQLGYTLRSTISSGQIQAARTRARIENCQRGSRIRVPGRVVIEPVRQKIEPVTSLIPKAICPVVEPAIVPQLSILIPTGVRGYISPVIQLG